MPELPEAETIARELNRRITGHIMAGSILNRADVVKTGAKSLAVLSNRRIIGVGRRAKRVIIHLDREAQIVFQLGMTGGITVCPIAQPTEPHTHLHLRFRESVEELRFRDPRRFGGVWILDGAETPTPVGECSESPRRSPGVRRTLGPLGLEPLEMTFRDFEEAVSRNRQIKALLMDQTVIAGLGNIYCDESLHAAGIHPLSQSPLLDDVARKRLFRAIRSTLRRAIRHNGSTLKDYRTSNGEPGSFQSLHQVYQRNGEPCRTCGTPILRLKAVGRSTFVCPNCQPTVPVRCAEMCSRTTKKRSNRRGKKTQTRQSGTKK